ncbi:hypothetical protein QC823_15940 [Halomonas vilamensis]|uniref:Uncharacterized protein n=1 Tax=Vreelandella vilamensis TaxID=531309 RepID=A0ABU1H818_9GAMM|nr:hypothetical protein [Halomonas vilamensis]MDR5900455.1 hypothetical protein [Halomonas vilamensis]
MIGGIFIAQEIEKQALAEQRAEWKERFAASKKHSENAEKNVQEVNKAKTKAESE